MFTHVAMAVSVAALVLTAVVLLSLRSLKSNVRGIHANVAATLGVAELLFLLGIHRTHNQVQGQGRAISVLMTTLAWKGLGPKLRARGRGPQIGQGFGAGCWSKMMWFKC